MGAARNKLLLPLLGEPVLAWTLKTIAQVATLEGVTLVGQPHDFPEFKAIAETVGIAVSLVEGGSTRQESVQRGLESLAQSNAKHVLIHDGARCLATPQLFESCDRALETVLGIVAAIPVKDTIKQVAETASDQKPNKDLTGLTIAATPPRAALWAAQTPQGFHFEPILAAYRNAGTWQATDDASVFEHAGQTVHIVNGEDTNLKITTPIDLAIAAWVLQDRQQS